MILDTDERLVVDCRSGDNSSVFHREMLDNPEEFATAEKPWCFDHNHGPTEFFATEDEACAAQRAYRSQHGFDPITGERLWEVMREYPEVAAHYDAIVQGKRIGTYSNRGDAEQAARAHVRALKA